MWSHHSHSGSFCAHAKGTLEEVVLEAIRRGFTHYGLSEHVPRYSSEDLYPEEADMTLDDLARAFDAYIIEAVRLKAAYMSSICLLVGLETELIRAAHDLPALKALLAKHADSIDYIVGSVHHAACQPIDFDQQTFERAVEACGGTVRRLHLDYFTAQHQLLLELRPEVVGHFDLCRLWQPNHRLDSDAEIWAAVRRNVQIAVDYGALFEVNAAAFRKGWSTAYPGAEVLQLILELGGKLCLSDDAHGPHAVGNHYRQARDYLERMGVQELFYLEPTPGCIGRGRTIAKRVEGDWRALPFWTSAR